MTSKNFSDTRQNWRQLRNIAELERNAHEKARDVAKYGIITIRSEESVYKAIEIMVKKNISGLPVVNNTSLVGIISEKDVLGLLYNAEFLPGNVGEYMTENIISFDEEDSLDDIYECLINNSFRRVPILHDGKLTGLITRADLLRAKIEKLKYQGLSDEIVEQQRNTILARDVMKSGLLTVRPQTPIYESIEILATNNITGLPVVDDFMNLVGIVSEKDILKLLYDPKVKPGKTEEFMTEQIVSFSQDDNLHDICDCLINNNFRRVPILDHGKIIGIISRADIIEYILKNKTVFFRSRHYLS